MEDSSGIYAITNTTNGKVYIGSAVCLSRRKREHRGALRKNKHSNGRLQNSWNKYGESSFEFRTIIICEIKDLIFYEQRAIIAFDSCKNGLNISPTAGNNFGIRHTEASKANFRIGAIGRIMPPQSEISRLRKSIAHKGRPHAPVSEETRRKISLAHKGKSKPSPSLETREKMAAAKRGRKLTEEHKAKISKAHMGKPKPWLCK